MACKPAPGSPTPDEPAPGCPAPDGPAGGSPALDGSAPHIPASATPAADSLHERHYSLLTALCMIVGVCIGSGIYFKADNVLVATGGSVGLGVAMFCIASVVIVFGGLTLSVYAARGEGAGGLLSYADDYLPAPLARAFNWNFAVLYLPVISAVLSWVVGVYFCLVFGLGGGFWAQMGVGLVFFCLCVCWNVLWPRASGWFQNATTFIKVLPLLAVGVAGMALGGGHAADDATALGASAAQATGAAALGGLAWLTAAAPIAFSFAGWSMSTGIAPELRDSRRNLPRALVVAPLVVLALYLAYFVGLSAVLGPATVVETGDGSLGMFFARLFGPGAETLPNVVALVSVMGSANGVILAMLRMPYALALRGDFPFARRVATVSPSLRFPLWSAVAAAGMTLLWMAAHAAVTTLQLIPNGDLSEVSVAFNMVLLCALFARVPMLWREGRAARDDGGAAPRVGALRGVVAPAVAVVGSLFVGGSALLSPSRWPFVALYVAILVALGVWRARSGKAGSNGAGVEKGEA